jgi:hypothetical protein
MRLSFLAPPTTAIANAIVLVLVLGGAAGCTSPSLPAAVCVAGATQSCLCVGGGAGVQSCKDDGSGFAACDCAGDTGPTDAVIDSSLDASLDSSLDANLADTADGAVGDTQRSETAGESGPDAATDGGADAVGDSGSVKFSGATGASWEVRTGGLNGPQGFSDYSPAGSSYFFAAYANGNAMARYDVASDAWTTVAANPQGVENEKGLAWIGPSLFQTKDSFMYRYSIASNTWTNVASGLPGTFYSMHAHDDGNAVFSMAADGTNRIVVFDTVTSVVSYVAGPSGTVYQARLAWDGATKALYVAPSPNLTLLWSYTPATGAVTARASIPEPSMGRIFCSDRAGHLYASGDTGSCSSSNNLWQYDTATNAWKRTPDLPFAHSCNGACTVTDDGWLFVSDGAGKLARLRLL